MTETAGNILVVDDDLGICRALHATLSANGFTVEEAVNGEAALALVRTKSFHAILLDTNMPGMGGLATCRELRRLSPALPILMLTVRDSQEDIVRALDGGADDYITKPFRVGELTARLKAAVRRNRASDRLGKALLVGDIALDPGRRTVTKSGQPIHLTPKEFDLLHHLMANAGMPVPHTKLLQVVWGPEYGNELEYLRTFIRQLRLKLEPEPAYPRYLLTDPYVGYRFCEGQSPPVRPKS